jgi:hypothetical protein
VDSRILQHKADMKSAMVAGRERSAVDARHIMLRTVVRIMDDAIYARVGTFVSRLESVSNIRHGRNVLSGEGEDCTTGEKKDSVTESVAVRNTLIDSGI